MAYRGDDPAPLLPASLEDGLKRWLWKVLGFLLLAACAALSASLLTWSVADPSLSRATSASARNLLGPPGALLSDLTMQMLGLAGVFALLPPLFWALELLTAKDPPSLRRKLVLAPLAVLFLAGALSSLPKAAAWPLHHGYGGVLGDLGLSILTSLLGHVNADRSAAAAGLFCFAAGMMGMMWSLGLTQRDIKLICSAGVGAGAGRRADARRSRVDLGAVAGWWRQLQTQVFAPKGNERSGPDPALMRDPPIIRAKPAPLEVEPVVEAPDHDPVVPEIVPERRFEPMPDPAPQSGRGIAFDHSTDRLTRTIAERFAPAGTEAARETASARQEPELPLPDESAAPADFAPPPAAHVPVPRGGEAGCRRPPLSILKRPAAGQSRRATHRGRAAQPGAPARERAQRFRRQGRGQGHPSRPRRHPVRARARARHQVGARHRACRRHRPLAGRGFRARRRRGRPQCDRHRAAEPAAREGEPAPAVRGERIPHHGRGAAAGTRPRHRRRAHRGGSRAHAASAGRGHHRLGQVGRRQRHDPVADLQALARPVPAADDRPQDAGALGLQRHPAPPLPGSHRAREGGGGAQLGGRRDGGPLPPHGAPQRAQHRRLQCARTPDAEVWSRPASQDAQLARCPTSSSSSTSSRT